MLFAPSARVLPVAALAALAALVARPAPAQACSCGRPGVEVSPGPAMKLPTNGVVRVSWWSGQVALDAQTIAVTTTGKTPVVVDVERTELTQGEQRTVILRPKQPLAAETRYEVRAARAAGEKAAVIGELTTGKTADTTAPTWAGVAKAAYLHPARVCCNCSTGDPHAEIQLATPDKLADGDAPAESLVFALWAVPEADPKAAKAARVFDAKVTPTALVRAWSGGKLVFGHASTCAARNFDFPRGKTMRLMVAPVDLAGNVGNAVEVTLDLTTPPPAPKGPKVVPTPKPITPGKPPAPAKPITPPAPARPPAPVTPAKPPA